MRVISGTHPRAGLAAPKAVATARPRVARLAAPRGLGTRPPGTRVREAAFNLIGPVDDARVLDLFAGSGAMGLEALSRGARRCVFVESDPAAWAVLEAQ